MRRDWKWRAFGAIDSFFFFFFLSFFQTKYWRRNYVWNLLIFPLPLSYISCVRKHLIYASRGTVHSAKLRWNEKYNNGTRNERRHDADPLGNNRDGIALTHINASNLCESIDRARSLKPCSLFNHSIAVGHSAQTAKRVTAIALMNGYKVQRDREHL